MINVLCAVNTNMHALPTQEIYLMHHFPLFANLIYMIWEAQGGIVAMKIFGIKFQMNIRANCMTLVECFVTIGLVILNQNSTEQN